MFILGCYLHLGVGQEIAKEITLAGCALGSGEVGQYIYRPATASRHLGKLGWRCGVTRYLL